MPSPPMPFDKGPMSVRTFIGYSCAPKLASLGHMVAAGHGPEGPNRVRIAVHRGTGPGPEKDPAEGPSAPSAEDSQRGFAPASLPGTPRARRLRKGRSPRPSPGARPRHN